jgi:MoaA/NifB/PqqE/SkfB family radical SAM enzyme
MQCLNKYIKNIDRIEFTVTNGCTGNCRHCSEGELKGDKRLDAQKAAHVIEVLSEYYKIGSIMTFGGESLLYPEIVYYIHSKAKSCGIPQRQLITNGCFTKNYAKNQEVARKLQESGVNDILLSVDCFHAEHLPLEWVRIFAEALLENYTGRFRLQPSWVRDESEDNPYNIQTKECLAFFDDLAIERNKGDVIFAEGNAAANLGEYFEKKPLDMNFKCGDALYSTVLDEIDEIMIDCNGNVLPCNFSIGNIYQQDILDMITEYNPYKNPFTKALLEKGIRGLLEEAETQNIFINPDEYYSPCAVCKAIADKIK